MTTRPMGEPYNEGSAVPLDWHQATEPRVTVIRHREWWVRLLLRVADGFSARVYEHVYDRAQDEVGHE